METSSELLKKKRTQRKRLMSGKGKTPTKRRRSTLESNHKFKYPLGKSGTDPLNLEIWPSDDVCSTCPPSPSAPFRQLGDQPIDPLPEQLHSDPLNLEGKINDFDSIMNSFNRPLPQPLPPAVGGKRVWSSTPSAGKKKRKATRSLSRSESSSNESQSTSSISGPIAFNPKAAVFRYGNYTQYYGYRNKGKGSHVEDPRVKLLKEEWFRGKDVLDVGSNSGLVTIAIAQKFSPLKITGVDIDSKLVRMAWKNLHRHFVPMVMPSGQQFPLSLRISHAPVNLQTNEGNDTDSFPNNVQFKQIDYVPKSDKELESVQSEYDVILCLSMTKWVHLNEGDQGLKRMFLKLYRHLRPGGLLILEPQPWSSYAKRKKLTPKIYENYQNISFHPEEFHSYLMSDAIGFSTHRYLGTSENTNAGFQRSVHLYVKGGANTQMAPPTTTVSAQATPPTILMAPPITAITSTNVNSEIGNDTTQSKSGYK